MRPGGRLRCPPLARLSVSHIPALPHLPPSPRFSSLSTATPPLPSTPVLPPHQPPPLAGGDRSTVRLDGTQETQENTRGLTSSATRSGGEACWGEPAPWSAEGEEDELYARRKILECKNRKESQEKKQEMQENEVSGWGFTWSEGELPGDAGCAGIACLGRVP